MGYVLLFVKSTALAPPGGGFEVLVFIKVRRLRFAFVSGAPLTVTLGCLR